MKKYFNYGLKGKEWYSLFFVYWLLFLVFYLMINGSKSGITSGDYFHTLAGTIVYFTGLIGTIVVSLVFTIPLCRKIYSGYSFDGNLFRFEGSNKTYAGLMLLWFYFPVIAVIIGAGFLFSFHFNTAGILLIAAFLLYLPSFVSRISRYLTGEIFYKEKRLLFTGSGFSLLIRLLIYFVLPVIVIAGTLFLIKNTVPSAKNIISLDNINYWVLLSYLLIIPPVYAVIKWYMDNMNYEELQLKLKARSALAMLFLLLQMILVIGPFVLLLGTGISFMALSQIAGVILCFMAFFVFVACLDLSIYFCYKYFITRTVLLKDGQESGKFGFEAKIAEVFPVIFVQSLFIIVTLGFYIPWAVYKIAKVTVSKTCLENK